MVLLPGNPQADFFDGIEPQPSKELAQAALDAYALENGLYAKPPAQEAEDAPAVTQRAKKGKIE
jgi:hypothetical protein